MDPLKVTDVMTHLVLTFRPEESVVDAARRLLANRISGAPVVEGGKLVGVATEADFINVRDKTVGDVMTPRVVSIGPDESVWKAAWLIHHHGVRRLPVVDQEGFVMGVLARSDLVRAMVELRPLSAL